jgi:hypothetical protein
MAYLRASGVCGQLAGTAAHLVLDLELRTLQVGFNRTRLLALASLPTRQLDNPSRWTSLRIAVCAQHSTAQC